MRDEGMSFHLLQQKNLKRRWLVQMLDILRAAGTPRDKTIVHCTRTFRLLFAHVYRVCSHEREALLSSQGIYYYQFAVSYNVLRIVSGMGGVGQAH
jgi:hypothetical protein